MRVLIATAMYPTAENPAFGSFVRTQMQSLQRMGVEVEPLILAGRSRKLIYPKGVLQLYHRLLTRPVDLVHAHFSYVGVVARLQLQVPLIVTFHGDDLLGSRNARGEIDPVSRIIAVGGQWLGRMVDACIVQSEEMANKLRGANVHIIPHEVDFAVFHPVERAAARRALRLDQHKKYLLFASNPQVAVKRFPLAQAVAERLASEDLNVELVVVHRETQDRLCLYMSACDALVFPSYQEGSPNIVKQAMACNLPIVATDVGDVRQVIQGTRACFICEPTVEDFADKLRAILQACPRTNGREQVRHLDSPNVARNVVQLYEETLRQASAAKFKQQALRE